MRKIIRIGFPIACLSIIGITFFMLNKAMNRVNEKPYNEKTSNTAEVESAENAVNSDDQNNNSEPKSYTTTIDSQKKATEKENQNKEKAIKIVKVIDGNRENVYYTNEGTENGEYIVAIRDKSTTKAIIYYIVNIEIPDARIYY